jgi:hypothetical protein
MCTSIGTAWNTDLASWATPQVTLTEVLITDLTSPTAAQAAVAVSHAGTRTGTNLAAGTAVLLGFPIARRYRGGKPRIYLPFFSSNDLASDNSWVTASVTGLVTAFGTFVGAIYTAVNVWGGGPQQVNVSYYEGFTVYNPDPGVIRAKNIPTKRAVPLVDVVTSIVGNPRPASQRRRNLQRT